MSASKSSDDSNSDNSSAIVVNNRFANDGSFLEMFKQMQKNSKNSDNLQSICNKDINKTEIESNVHKTNNPTEDKTQDIDSQHKNSAAEDTNQTTSSVKKSIINTTNKRKPKTLKTGLIKKQRNEDSDNDETGGEPTDAWNRYMKEVRKYKEKYGDDNDKNRPLVK